MMKLMLSIVSKLNGLYSEFIELLLQKQNTDIKTRSDIETCDPENISNKELLFSEWREKSCFLGIN